MANYNNLRAAIQATIKANGAQEITGPVLQSQLLAMITSLGLGYQYMGVAEPDTNPGEPDQRVFYVAVTEGVYTEFGDIVIAQDEIAFLVWNSIWRKETLSTGIGEGALRVIAEALQSLQAQVDSVAARNNFDELTASAFYADIAAVNTLYVDGFVVGGYAIDGEELSEAITLAHTAYQKPETGIPNTDLEHSSLTIGTTAIALGATAPSLAGLTSVTAQKFYLTADLYLEVVDGNVHLHTPTENGLYVDGFISAFGLSDGGGGGGIDLDAMWDNLQINQVGIEGYNLKIHTAHIPDMASTYNYVKTSALSSYVTLSRLESDEVTLSSALQSLQSQVNAVAARDMFDELKAGSLFADVAAVSSLYVDAIELGGNDLTATLTGINGKVSTLEGYFDSSGNAKSALKLTTVSKTAWGQTYWTSGGVPDSISGNMTGVGSITASGLIKTTNYVQATRFYLTDSIYFLVDANGVKLEGAGLYTDYFMSAGGYSSGGTSQGIDWSALLADTTEQINVSHLPITINGSGDYVANVVVNSGTPGGIVFTKGTLPSLAGFATTARLDSDELTIAAALQSLQSQADSLASRDMFDELKASALFSDVITAEAVYGDFVGALTGNADTASYLVNSSYGIGSGVNPVYFSGGRPVASSSTVGSAAVPVFLSGGVITACTGSSLFDDLDSTANLNLYATIAGRTRIVYDLYATYDSSGEDIADAFGVASRAFQSLQAQIDSVASRNAFGELVASYISADTVAAGTLYGALNGNATTASYLVSSGYTAGTSTLPVYFSGGLPVACTASALFGGLSSSAGTNLSITIAGQSRTATLYATYDSAGENISSAFGSVSSALQSLQSQIDSVASRNCFNELLATTVYADMVSVGKDLNATGNIFAMGASVAGAQSASSDRRLKSGVVQVPGEKALAIIMQLKPVEWIWNANSTLEGQRCAGVVAQDVEGVVPFAVSGTDFLAVNYNVFHAYEIAGLQNHESRITKLEQKVFA